VKKIGILHGRESSFPQALVARINEKNVAGISAEPVSIDKVMQGYPTDYAVIFDRISQDVPFYRGYLKNAALMGTAVINNPFWWSADEKFFNNCLAVHIGVPVPKTVLLPSHEHPDDTNADSFTNLKYPLDWESIFGYVGFPAFMKPFSGGGWKSVYKLENIEEFFEKHQETGQLVMMLQEAIEFDAYFRCYCIGGKHVRIMHYEPRNPHHLRYVANHNVSEELLQTIHDYVLRLNHALGYDFNTVEFAVRDGIPYAIDFCNPAPDADVHSVGEENFEWVVETVANYAIERAQNHKPGSDNLTWGTYMRYATGSLGSFQPNAGENTNSEKKKPKAKQEIAPAQSTAPQQSEVLNAHNVIDRLSIDKTSADHADDLTVIVGIGPVIAKKLNDIGIYSFKQLSQLTPNDIAIITDAIKFFPGRIERDNWQGQALALLAGVAE
jgi:predicted flap endonuclease-1-like 5' DNA nuclease/glutathione synthase/RimK-type ligase-like ATP-grasp enzyme